MPSQSWGRAAGSCTGLCPCPRGGQRGSALPWDTVGASASLRLLPSPSCVGCLSAPAPQMVGKSWLAMRNAGRNCTSKKMLVLLRAALVCSVERLSGRAEPGLGTGSAAHPSSRMLGRGTVSLRALLIRLASV